MVGVNWLHCLYFFSFEYYILHHSCYLCFRMTRIFYRFIMLKELGVMKKSVVGRKVCLFLSEFKKSRTFASKPLSFEVSRQFLMDS